MWRVSVIEKRLSLKETFGLYKYSGYGYRLQTIIFVIKYML